MIGTPLNENQPKVLTLSPNGKGGVKIYASVNLTKAEKIAMLKQALEHLDK